MMSAPEIRDTLAFHHRSALRFLICIKQCCAQRPPMIGQEGEAC